ncbi:uncharacterized membrane protein [[Candida] jaroonii]|uniref:Uncharacterized membrane protein n=1 Tax=[Candida] jaroonii TaxID=467808 RepID=A0ACA9Y6T6_9ASCO|nr:uncharacterized membrane protein [[Candida] jaroonii]
MKLVYWLFLSLAFAHGDMEDMPMANSDNHDSHNDISDGSNEMSTTGNSVDSSNMESMASMVPIPHVMKHMHGMPILQTELLPQERLFWENYNATNYINYPNNNKTAMSLYFVFMTISFIFINPILMVINNLNPQSINYLIGLVINSGIALFGLFNYSIFIHSIPDLYPGNVFNKFNWIYAVTVIGQLIFTVLKIGYLRQSQYKSIDQIDSPAITLYDLSRNQSPNSFDLNDDETHIDNSDNDHDERFTNDLSNHLNFVKGKFNVNKIFDNSLISRIIDSVGKISVIVFNILNWFNFLFIFVYIPTGIATFGLFGQGKTVFNLLAHFIKGGIFFFLGVISLARYCGAFQNKGWAWNYKFITSESFGWWSKIQPKGLITMEFIESFLIFFYGITNVFMEHLANPGGKWSAKDLEHASIAFIYIGAGFSGLLVEHKLNDWRFDYSKNIDDKSIIKSSPGFSPNPFPILTIFWTGILMSQHQQASELSTKIHSQWGTMFVYGTAFRFLTYILNLILSKPPSLDMMIRPSQPITELLVSFCLISGGMIFMESCDPIVLALEYKGYDAMFTLNIALGVTCLLMAWIMVVFQFKNFIKNKYY